MRQQEFDYVVVGSGLAGLAFALKASEHGRVAVLTKAEVTESNTNYAQGGIAAAIGESDSWELHEEDTLRAGAGLCDPAAVRFLVTHAEEAIRWLLDLGARFDSKGEPRTLETLELGREGGHSQHRIVHHVDKTGWEVERAVTEAVRDNPRIKVVENAFVTNLIVENGRCQGVVVVLSDVGPRRFSGRAVVLATGGCGRMYNHTTNPRVATGDGIALAKSVGATIENMEFIQFHPTTLYHPQLRGYLISEAVRGAGATLRNHLGRRFMYDYDDRLELAPRDIVARAIELEMRKLDTWCVYLDTTHLPREFLQSRFPNISNKLASVGLEIYRDWIPIVPAQHYSCGGVKTDLAGRTDVPGLYAVGEVASTGVHGANRLASNSLLEALVFAFSAAEAVRGEPRVAFGDTMPPLPKSIAETEAVRLRRDLRNVMTECVGVIRSDAGLERARNKIEQLISAYNELPEAPYDQYALETHNLLVVAREVVHAALARRENVGLHYNVDLVNEPALRSSSS